MGRKDYKEAEETSGDEEYVHCLHCDNGFTGVYMSYCTNADRLSKLRIKN